MDGSPTISLLSAIDSIRYRIVAGAEELEQCATARRGPTVRGPNWDKFFDHVVLLRKLADVLAELKGPLQASDIRSSHLSLALQERLTQCELSFTKVHRHILVLVSDQGIAAVDTTSWTSYGSFIDAFTNIFGFLGETLKLATREWQDQKLESKEHLMLKDKAENALQQLPSENALPDYTSGNVEGSSRAGPPPSDMPPSYNDATTSSPPPNRPEVSSSSSWNFSSITDSLKSMASSILPGPSPLATALCHASADGNTSHITGLLKQGASVNGRDAQGHTPLHHAVKANQVEAVQLLLNHGASENKGKPPPLYVAASQGHIALAKMFLERGAQANKTDITGHPYFLDVVTSGNASGVKFMLENKADPNAESIEGTPAVYHAVRRGFVDVVAALLDYGAKVDATGVDGTPLLIAAAEQPEIRELLLQRGADPDTRSIAGTTALYGAISKYDVAWAKRLLDAGANVNCGDAMGRPALISILRDNKFSQDSGVDMVRLLLDYGANPDCKDIFKSTTALQYAMQRKSPDAVAALLKHGAPVSDYKKKGELLVWAVEMNRPDIARMMLDVGADPDATNSNGTSALAMAGQKGNTTMMQLLKEKGASREAADDSGITDVRTNISEHLESEMDAPPEYHAATRSS